MNKFLRYFLIFIFLFLNIFNSQAQNLPIIQVEENTFEFIQGKIQILEDKNYSLEQMQSQEYESKFLLYDEIKIPRGKSQYWLKITLQNTTSQKQRAILGNNHFDFLTLYYKNSKDSLIVEKSGNMYPSNQKAILRGADSYLPVDLSPQQKLTVYIKAENKDAPFFRFVNLDWAVYSNTTFEQEGQKQKMFVYIFVGACGVMLLYNVVFLFLIREISNILYVLYNLAMLLVGLDASGELFEWYPSIPASYQNIITVYVGTSQVVFLSFFAIAILQVKSRMPKTFTWYATLMTVGIITIPIYTLGFQVLHFVLAISINLANNVIILFISIRSILKGYKSTYYFFAGFLFYYIGATVHLLQTYRVLPYEIFYLIPINILELSVMIELSLFSLGLGYRINIIREELKEKELEQERLKREEEEKRNALIQKQNEELEIKVKERTEELAETNQELQKINGEMTLTLDALQEKNIIIESKNQAINDSINYAQRIQEAILPYEQDLQRNLPNHFILFRPRDIVSGDFYWFAEKEDTVIIASIDCTGHGVPGAFMSLIANELLNHIVHDKKIISPEKILNELHKGIRKALKQQETKNRDGMDMAVVNINQKKNKLTFAGARNPLIYIQHEELQVIKGDKVSIGGEQREKERVFTKHELYLDSSLTFYIFSDGYQDQFGGEQGRKFSPRRLRETFYQMYQEPLKEQKEKLSKKFVDWKGKEEQIDDILIIGAKIG